MGAGITAGVGAVAGGILSSQRASEQNKAIEEAQQARVNAAQFQSKQIAQRLAITTQGRLAQQRAIQGRIRVAAGQSGIGIESLAPIQRQVDIDFQQNLLIDRLNASNQGRALSASTSAQIQALENQRANPLLQAFQGALGGAQTGISFSNFARELGQSQDVETRE